jgi:dihydroxyacetone kinase
MTIEKVSKDSCVIITTRGQAKERYEELLSVLSHIRELGHTVTRTMENTKAAKGKVEYLVNGMGATKVRNLYVKHINKSMATA